MQGTIRKTARIGIIAAIYVVLTYVFQGLSFLPMQLRLAEALTLLPMLFPEAVWGIGIGCFIANLLSPAGLIDVILGSLTSTLAAYITYRFRWRVAGYTAPIILNAVIISAYLRLLANLPYLITALGIAFSQTVVVFGLGYPLLWYLKRWQHQ